jgi:hypothetical protein
MKHIKTYEHFNHLFEDAEAPAAPATAPAAEPAVAPEEQKEIIDATAAATKAEMANKSAFSQKLKSKVAQAQAQSQSQPEPAKNEGFVFENAQGEMLTKENMQKYADALVKKLPILKAGDKEVRFRGQKVAIPANAEYEAHKATVTAGAVYVFYKDRNGKFEDVQFIYQPSKEEIAHVTKIYSEFGKKLATQQKRSKLLSLGAKILVPLGVVAAIAGMAIQGSHHGSGSEAFREIPGIVVAGGAAIAAGAAAGITSGQIGKKIDVAEDAVAMFTALIKAFCDSLNMNMMEVQTVGDIQSLLTMDKIEVEVENTTTSAKVESVSNKLKGFDKF